MILIDTSAWVYEIRRPFHPAVKARVDSILAESDVAINNIIGVSTCLPLRQYIMIHGFANPFRILWPGTGSMATVCSTKR